MKWLITGGTGFIGTELVRYLQARKEVLTLLSRRAVTGPGAILGDLAQMPPPLGDGEYEIVCHLAGLARRPWRTSAWEYDRMNLEGTRNLLRALDRLSRPPGLIIFSSSVGVYGLDSGTQIDESHPCRPVKPYDRSKLEAEALLGEWCRRREVSSLILRLSLVIGRGARGNFGSLVRAIHRGYYFRVGRGGARRSMLWVEDLPPLIWHAAGYRGHGCYNLTDGCHPTVADLDRAIAASLGRKPPMAIPDPIVSIIRRMAKMAAFIPKAGTVSGSLEKLTRELTFSDGLARRELGWNPKPVLEIIADCVRDTDRVEAR